MNPKTMTNLEIWLELRMLDQIDERDSMSDAEFINAHQRIIQLRQEKAIRRKNGTWNEDPTLP